MSALDDRTNDFASFSNDGSVVDVIAPGVAICQPEATVAEACFGEPVIEDV